MHELLFSTAIPITYLMSAIFPETQASGMSTDIISEICGCLVSVSIAEQTVGVKRANMRPSDWHTIP